MILKLSPCFPLVLAVKYQPNKGGKTLGATPGENTDNRSSSVLSAAGKQFKLLARSSGGPQDVDPEQKMERSKK